MKNFARWLYMRTHRRELCAVARIARGQDLPGMENPHPLPDLDMMLKNRHSLGALHALTALNLLTT